VDFKNLIDNLMTFYFLFILGFLILAFIILKLYKKSKVFTIASVPYNKYTLVLGAGLEKTGLPTDILADRVKTAVNLIKAKKTDVLILSGSSKKYNYSEPESMKSLAISLGLKDTNMVLDLRGKTTYDSCVNLKSIENLHQITIVTQSFHLPRAIFLAEMLGYKAFGIPANLFQFSIYKIVYWHLREILAFPINLAKVINHLFQHEA
jgi:SanA protein